MDRHTAVRRHSRWRITAFKLPKQRRLKKTAEKIYCEEEIGADEVDGDEAWEAFSANWSRLQKNTNVKEGKISI